MEWVLKSLLPPIAKDVVSKFLRTKEEAIKKAMKYDMIFV